MAHILLFHHAQGLTEGIAAFADDLRAAGHHVTVPDLYDGRTFPTVDEGVAHARRVGFGALLDAGVASVEGLPEDIVYGGFSLGAMPAQHLAQVRSGARGALLYHGGAPASEFGDGWPAGVGLQAHVMRHDPWSVDDIPALEELARESGGQLFLYDGDAHLFTDRSLDEYEAAAADLVMERTLSFLDALP